jgi:hypothetical protein
MPTDKSMAYWRSKCCEGEKCALCDEPAAAKIGEEIFDDDPHPIRHNLTAYVCAKHFAEIMGPVGARMVMRSVQDV